MKIIWFVILIILIFFVLKLQVMEFNVSLLDSGNLFNVDFMVFSCEGYVVFGNYIFDIWFNDQLVWEQYLVRVVLVVGFDVVVICVIIDMVVMLGFKDKIIYGLKFVIGILDG